MDLLEELDLLIETFKNLQPQEINTINRPAVTYCSCCGEPNYLPATESIIIHSSECIWSDNNFNLHKLEKLHNLYNKGWYNDEELEFVEGLKQGWYETFKDGNT